MKKNLKFFVFYLFAMGCLLLQFPVNSYAEDTLLDVPEYQAEFNEYGLSITSSDSDYLNAIESIRLVYTYLDQGNDVSFSNEQWIVKENELFLPCYVYLEAGVKVGAHQSIHIDAQGYTPTQTSDYLGFSKAKDANCFVNENGEIVITSSDEYWLKMLRESMSESVLDINVNPHLHHDYIGNTDLIYEPGRILIPSLSQIKARMYTGRKYLIGTNIVGGVYYYQDIGEVVVRDGYNYLPVDASVQMISGNIVIYSSNQEWLDEIVENKSVTGNISVVLTQNVNELFHFFNDENQTDLIRDGNYLIITKETILEKGLESGSYQCTVFSVSFEPKYCNLNIEVACVPSDIQIINDEASGAIYVRSNNLKWLKSLVEVRDQYAAVYVTRESSETWFWNTLDETDLVFENNQVVISKEVQQKRGLIENEWVQFEFYSDYYGLSEPYDVQIQTGGNKILPEDIVVFQDEQGNLTIQSSNTQWMDALSKGSIELFNEQQGIFFYVDGEDIISAESVIVENDILKNLGLANGEYNIRLIASEYPEYQTAITLVQCKELFTGDFKIEYLDEIGLVVNSENQEYIASISSIWMQINQQSSGYVYDNSQFIKKDHQLTIKNEELRKDGVAAGEYIVYVNSNLYGVKWQSVEIFETLYDTYSFYRLAGDTRYETSFKIADALKQVSGVDKFDVVILATGEGFADALSGSYLASKKGAPILMVNPKNNNTSTIREYLDKNMNPDGLIYILGGTSAVPSFVEEELKGYKIKRLAGETRYDTNLLILEEAGVSDEPLLVCSGKGYADSLSASATGLPILLVDWNLNNKQRSFLEKRGLHDIIILGGTAAVNEIAGTAVSFYGGTKRFAGETRYDTSAAVARYFFKDAEQVVLTYARNYPDGICGGPLAYYLGAPMLLASDSNVSSANSYTTLKGITKGVVLGGPKLISDEAVEMILDTKPVAFD